MSEHENPLKDLMAEIAAVEAKVTKAANHILDGWARILQKLRLSLTAEVDNPTSEVTEKNFADALVVMQEIAEAIATHAVGLTPATKPVVFQAIRDLLELHQATSDKFRCERPSCAP